MLNIDLHTHSEASPDGGLSIKDYETALSTKLLDYIAVTDHNTIDFALELNKKLGDQIIVGEEIMTLSGEIIGLYLTENIPAHLPLDETIERIKSQGGLVYIPHPFEKVRSGLSLSNIEKIADKIDIVEVINGRALSLKHQRQANEFATWHSIPVCASSDAHGWHGWSQTYTTIAKKPTKENLYELLGSAELTYKKPSVRAILYPKYNKLRKVL